jgi:hypothetical protein
MSIIRPKYWLIQSTVVTVEFGPFVDAGDGVSLEIGLAAAMDHATTGIRVSKGGSVFASRGDSLPVIYDAMGCYLVHLSTPDTDTLGILRLVFEEAVTCRPVAQDFMVLPDIYRPAQSSGGVFHGELTRS